MNQLTQLSAETTHDSRSNSIPSGSVHRRKAMVEAFRIILLTQSMLTDKHFNYKGDTLGESRPAGFSEVSQGASVRVSLPRLLAL